jgi:acyl dehydratase
MALRYPEILSLSVKDVPVSWTDRETILYALSVGAGTDPLDRSELPLVWEKELKAIPTMATVIATARLIKERLPVDWTRVLAGEQSIILHEPMPATCSTAVSDCRVAGVWDKGADKGAVVAIENILRAEQGGPPLATIVTTIFARADGGCGAPREGQPPLDIMPTRDPDIVIEVATREDQALLYRLNGDRHPLHIDPDFAGRAGFQRPILHGLCTFGITCRVAMRHYAENDPARILSHRARFSGTLFPGETIAMSLWRDGQIVSFEAHAKDRGTRVIGNGRMEMRPA